MTMTTRTLHLPGTSRVAVPLRETGASALDRRTTAWAAPDPTTIVLDPWGPPATAPLLARQALSPWSAPAASTRVDMAAPTSPGPASLAPPHPNSVPISTVEPMHAVRLPDLVALARVSGSAPIERPGRRSSVPRKPRANANPGMDPIDATPVRLPRPTIDDLVRSDAEASRAVDVDHSGVTGRVLATVVVGVGLFTAAVAALTTLL